MIFAFILLASYCSFTRGYCWSLKFLEAAPISSCAKDFRFIYAIRQGHQVLHRIHSSLSRTREQLLTLRTDIACQNEDLNIPQCFFFSQRARHVIKQDSEQQAS
ncbi:hypothetical protein BC939DRAFT_470902 [Gamsiella multidivaricata]|uniref:uncharacterized protein n=1 Tax=Gamsiella multidivaricata TaxID=101098 RepID=UPI00221EE546|nr:uncharacterized protein BC939DRAFT_470902 [Gamsiella multidivaricata]KAI7815948.1 hypothetical protein BC939DRAFT_470902 [Gamsiella multidivaricata]